MSLYLIFSIITVFLSLAFALLHLLVSLSELKKGKKTLGIYLIFLGSGLATFSLILYFLLPIVALFIWLIGVSLICYGAYWNGKHKENFNPAHHVIRLGIALILTILLALI
ncbi:MAG: glucuronide permease [Streptococcus salivarius]|uniref:glucuronide permease n=1 Tax=Streptococcus sp. TaxID=1306 RepID=UPI0029096FFE|nr:glucuronide permease [Streptococcus sp.]MDU7943275.1 glucuronide permease [Streptococcus salivarius]MDU8045431.1 glucuronide permease [Streptococcus sp.]